MAEEVEIKELNDGDAELFDEMKEIVEGEDEGKRWIRNTKIKSKFSVTNARQLKYTCVMSKFFSSNLQITTKMLMS